MVSGKPGSASQRLAISTFSLCGEAMGRQDSEAVDGSPSVATADRFASVTIPARYIDASAVHYPLDLARSHYENFPVLAPFLGRRRAELAAIYAFCRTTDDLGDQAPGDRLEALDRWEEALRRALEGNPAPRSPVLAAVAEVARRRALAPELFLRLIEANRRDQQIRRYPDEAALLDYCWHSATPVGRMVLGVIGVGARPAELGELADATCIGLQLANFWQDLRRDWAQGRCYLPLDHWQRRGLDPETELERKSASPELRELVAEQVGGAREWLRRGWPLADRLPVRWRSLVRGFSRGGWAICDAIQDQGFDPLRRCPVVPRATRRWIVIREFLRAPRTGLRLGARS